MEAIHSTMSLMTLQLQLFKHDVMSSAPIKMELTSIHDLNIKHREILAIYSFFFMLVLCNMQR
jgi:hypothetical protein